MKHRRGGPSVPLILYSRAECHLCDVMKAQLAAARFDHEWTLVQVDIDTDPALVARFGESVPVLEIAGRVAFKGRLEPADLERKFRRRAAEWFAARAAETGAAEEDARGSDA